MLVAEHAGAVGVAEEQVVELGQEPHRRRDVGADQRRLGQVEQLPAGLVAAGPQLAPEPVGDLAEPAQPDQAWTSATLAGPNAAR